MIARGRILGAALALAAFCVASVAAQDDAGEGVPILIVDMERIKSDTAAGRDMLAKRIDIRQRIQAGIAERTEALRLEEQNLASERDTLSPEKFRERVEAFEEQVFANRAFSERESRRLQLVLSRASALLRERATTVLAGIMRERGAEVLLDASQIVLSVDRLDITDEAILRLDEAMPEMPVDLSEPGE